MPNNSLQSADEQPREEGGAASSQLTVLLQRAIGLDNTPKFTSAQVDEVLGQRRQMIDYIHSDNQRDSYDNKFYLLVILVFILVFSGGVIYFKPDLFSQVLSFLAGLFGGGLGGYGLAKKKD